MPALHPVLVDLPEYPVERVRAAVRRLTEAGRTVYDFSVGDPFEPTAELIQQALRDGVAPVCRYPSSRGIPALRTAVAGYLQRRFGVTIDAETQVLPTRGSKEAIFHLPFAFLQPGGPKDTVVHPTPGYTVYASGTRFAGGVAHGVPMVPDNRFLLEPEALPAEVLERMAVLWINYPHNPSATLAPDDYLERLARFAAEHDVVVCSDECYVDIYSDTAPRSILEFGTKNLLAFHSCSKRSGMTGYRTGFVAGDADLLAALAKLRPNIGVATPAFVEAAAAAAWSDDAHVDARRTIFNAKREVLKAFLVEAGLTPLGDDATFFMWFRAPGGDDVAYCERLRDEAGIVLMPGSYFGAGGEGFCRVALVPDLATCREAVARWRELS